MRACQCHILQAFQDSFWSILNLISFWILCLLEHVICMACLLPLIIMWFRNSFTVWLIGQLVQLLFFGICCNGMCQAGLPMYYVLLSVTGIHTVVVVVTEFYKTLSHHVDQWHNHWLQTKILVNPYCKWIDNKLWHSLMRMWWLCKWN